jgi:hypothetical protein
MIKSKRAVHSSPPDRKTQPTSRERSDSKYTQLGVHVNPLGAAPTIFTQPVHISIVLVDVAAATLHRTFSGGNA